MVRDEALPLPQTSGELPDPVVALGKLAEQAPAQRVTGQREEQRRLHRGVGRSRARHLARIQRPRASAAQAAPPHGGFSLFLTLLSFSLNTAGNVARSPVAATLDEPAHDEKRDGRHQPALERDAVHIHGGLPRQPPLPYCPTRGPRCRSACCRACSASRVSWSRRRCPRRPEAWAPGGRKVAERDRASGAGPPMGRDDEAADRGAALPPSGWPGPVGCPRWGGAWGRERARHPEA